MLVVRCISIVGHASFCGMISLLVAPENILRAMNNVN